MWTDVHERHRYRVQPTEEVVPVFVYTRKLENFMRIMGVTALFEEMNRLIRRSARLNL